MENPRTDTHGVAATPANLISICPQGSAAPATYSPAVLVKAGSNTLHVSGQVGVDRSGATAATFAEQAELACQSLLDVLNAAGMGAENLVKVTTYLTDASTIPMWRAARARVLGQVRPASTLVVVRELADPRWLVEVEAIAAAV